MLEEKNVSLLAKDIEELQLADTKYKSQEKFEHDKEIILNTPWNISVVLQNKTSKISDLVNLNLEKNSITDVNSKKIFTALRGKYKSSNMPHLNDLAEEI